MRSLVLVEPVLFAAARAAGDPVFAPFLSGHTAFENEVRAGRREQGARLFHAAWGGEASFDEMPEAQRQYILERIHFIVAQGPSLRDDTGGLLRYLGLESLGVPVLLVEGGESPLVIGAIMGELVRRLPDATRLVVPGAGHMVPITHPQAVAEAILAHLNRC